MAEPALFLAELDLADDCLLPPLLLEDAFEDLPFEDLADFADFVEPDDFDPEDLLLGPPPDGFDPEADLPLPDGFDAEPDLLRDDFEGEPVLLPPDDLDPPVELPVLAAPPDLDPEEELPDLEAVFFAEPLDLDPAGLLPDLAEEPPEPEDFADWPPDLDPAEPVAFLPDEELDLDVPPPLEVPLLPSPRD